MPAETQAAAIRWVNNDNLIVTVYAQQPVEADRWTITRLLGINRQTKKFTRILWESRGQNASDVIWIASDGRPEIMVVAQDSIYLGDSFWPSVWRVNVETGKRNLVQQGRIEVSDWYSDAVGNIRAGVSYNDSSRKFRLLYRATGSGAFRQVDSADTRRLESLTAPFLFIPGTNHALAIHDNDAGRSAIYEVDLTTQDDIRTVYTAPADSEVVSVRLSEDGSALLGASYIGTTTGTVWFDPVLAQVQAAIDKSVPNRRARIVSMNADRRRLLVLIDRADTPGAYYYFDVASDKMQRIAWQNEQLGTRPLAPVRMVHYKARDGLDIEAVLTLPADRAAKNLPVIMLPHGGPWAQDTLDYDYWAQFLASRGYAVVQPNFRGSTGYGTAFERRGEGQLGLAMQDDVTDGLAWAVQQGIADPKRACIVGASYGGYAAMWGVAKDPDLYRCAVSIAGVANLRREVNDFGNTMMGGKFRDDWQRMTPDFAAVSPINAVPRIKVPLLLIHGRKDLRVDYKQSDAMYGKMRAAGKVVELVPLAEADHFFQREADRVVLLNSLETFLNKYNPADPAPSVH